MRFVRRISTLGLVGLLAAGLISGPAEAASGSTSVRPGAVAVAPAGSSTAAPAAGDVTVSSDYYRWSAEEAYNRAQAWHFPGNRGDIAVGFTQLWFVGGRFGNYEGRLPVYGCYYEYDMFVRPVGTNRGPARIVIDFCNVLNGMYVRYWSSDHYYTFHRY